MSLYTSQVESELLKAEVEKNLVEPGEVDFGYLKYSSRVQRFRAAKGVLPLVSLLTLTIPNLFGLPISYTDFEIEVVLTIYDIEHVQLAEYAAIGKSRNRVAYYYGYKPMDAYHKTRMEALINAFDDIRRQIESDSDSINDELLKTAKKENLLNNNR